MAHFVRKAAEPECCRHAAPGLKFHFADKKLIFGFIEPECDKLEFFFL
jgi:hypothetical protein